MYTNNAYLNNSKIDIKDKSKPLIVTSVGTYHLHTRPKLPTFRPHGGRDFQLLYIAAGKAHFYFDEKEEIDKATIYFSEHYNEDISIDKYAENNHVSVSWFIRHFKQYTGYTPIQYILSKRIYKLYYLIQL